MPRQGTCIELHVTVCYQEFKRYRYTLATHTQYPLANSAMCVAGFPLNTHACPCASLCVADGKHRRVNFVSAFTCASASASSHQGTRNIGDTKPLESPCAADSEETASDTSLAPELASRDKTAELAAWEDTGPLCGDAADDSGGGVTADASKDPAVPAPAAAAAAASNISAYDVHRRVLRSNRNFAEANRLLCTPRSSPWTASGKDASLRSVSRGPPSRSLASTCPDDSSRAPISSRRGTPLRSQV